MMSTEIIDLFKSHNANKLFPKPCFEAVVFMGVDFYDK